MNPLLAGHGVQSVSGVAKMLTFNTRLNITLAVELAFNLVFGPEYQGGYSNWFRHHALQDHQDNGGRVLYFATQVINLARIRVGRKFYEVSEEQKFVLNFASEILENAEKNFRFCSVEVQHLGNKEIDP